MARKNRREQAPKPRNRALAAASMEHRQGSRTSPVPSGKAYQRRPKHREW